MQLKKIKYLLTFFLIPFLSFSQERTAIEYLLLDKTENFKCSFAKDSSSVSFGFYFDGYHNRIKRDSLEEVKMKRRKDFPNVIPHTTQQLQVSVAFWSLKKKNTSSVANLPYITLNAYYKNWRSYYFTNKLLVIVPLKNKTFDIWECRLDAM